jgi:hypothetical protein
VLVAVSAQVVHRWVGLDEVNRTCHEDTRVHGAVGCLDVATTSDSDTGVSAAGSPSNGEFVQRAVESLTSRAGVAIELGERFAAAGYELRRQTCRVIGAPGCRRRGSVVDRLGATRCGGCSSHGKSGEG